MKPTSASSGSAGESRRSSVPAYRSSASAITKQAPSPRAQASRPYVQVALARRRARTGPARWSSGRSPGPGRSARRRPGRCSSIGPQPQLAGRRRSANRTGCGRPKTAARRAARVPGPAGPVAPAAGTSPGSSEPIQPSALPPRRRVGQPQPALDPEAGPERRPAGRRGCPPRPARSAGAAPARRRPSGRPPGWPGRSRPGRGPRAPSSSRSRRCRPCRSRPARRSRAARRWPASQTANGAPVPVGPGLPADSVTNPWACSGRYGRGTVVQRWMSGSWQARCTASASAARQGRSSRPSSMISTGSTRASCRSVRRRRNRISVWSVRGGRVLCRVRRVGAPPPVTIGPMERLRWFETV